MSPLATIPDGWDLDSILILPLMMSAFRVSSSVLSSAGTLPSNSLNGERPVPSFSSVPTYGSLLKLPSLAAVMASLTATSRPL